MAIAVASRIYGLPSLSPNPMNREALLQRETNRLGDVIDSSRNGRRQNHARLEHWHLRRRNNRSGRRSGWVLNLGDDPWLLACIVLSGLAVCTAATWLMLAIFHTPARFLSILESQGIEGLGEAIILFWQRLI